MTSIARRYGLIGETRAVSTKSQPESHESQLVSSLRAEVERLTAEVARLKRELAGRIMAQPAPDADKPWLAAGMSRASWFRRKRSIASSDVADRSTVDAA